MSRSAHMSKYPGGLASAPLRGVAVVAALTLFLGACGGGDDSPPATVSGSTGKH